MSTISDTRGYNTLIEFKHVSRKFLVSQSFLGMQTLDNSRKSTTSLPWALDRFIIAQIMWTLRIQTRDLKGPICLLRNDRRSNVPPSHFYSNRKVHLQRLRAEAPKPNRQGVAEAGDAVQGAYELWPRFPQATVDAEEPLSKVENEPSNSFGIGKDRGTVQCAASGIG
jgi:hypothetical protein